MRLRRLVPVTGLLVALTLSSCTSEGDSKDAGSSTPSGVATGGGATSLSSTLKAGVGKLASAHFVITGTVSGQPLTGSGDQKVDNGTLTGLQAQAKLPVVGDVGIVVDATKRYVKVPPPLATAARPWVRVTADSKNLVVKQFAGLLDAALAAGDLGGLADLADAATSTRKVGSDPVDGTPATRYAIVVDPAKLPDKAASVALGTATIPVDLWVDAQDRPLRVHAKLAVVGQPVEVTVTFSKYDAPVTITAPPASQIAPD